MMHCQTCLENNDVFQCSKKLQKGTFKIQTQFLETLIIDKKRVQATLNLLSMRGLASVLYQFSFIEINASFDLYKDLGPKP